MKLDVDGYNPLLGESYGEMAADSRSMHKSQGFGVARTRTPIVEYFKLLASSDPKEAAREKPLTGILDGIDVTLKRFAGATRLHGLVDKALAKFDPAAPYASVPALVAVDGALSEISDAGWRAEKQREVSQSGRRLRRSVRRRDGGRLSRGARDGRRGHGDRRRPLAGGGDARRGPVPVRGERSRRRAQARDAEAGRPAALRRRGPLRAQTEREAASRARARRRRTGSRHHRTPGSTAPIRRSSGCRNSASPVEVTFVFTIGGRKLTVARPVSYKWTDPVMGERYRALEVTPAVSVRPETRCLDVPPRGGPDADGAPGGGRRRRRQACCVPRRPPAGPSSRPRRRSRSAPSGAKRR